MVGVGPFDGAQDDGSFDEAQDDRVRLMGETRFTQYCPVPSITRVQASSISTPSFAAMRSSSSFSAPGLKMMRRGFRDMI